jgi:hypothetical protein
VSEEIAQGITSDSILKASLESARAYPDLKILCLHCHKSVLGAVLPTHLDQHLLGSLPPPNHWEAL